MKRRVVARIAFVGGILLALPATAIVPARAAELYGTLLGQSLDGNYYPLPFARVDVCRQAGSPMSCAHGYTNPDGKFLVGGIDGGEYTVSIQSNQGNPVPIESGQGLVASEKIFLKPQDSMQVDFRVNQVSQ